MSEWKRATSCPLCGGQLIVSDFYTFSRDYRLTKAGVLSKRYTVSDADYTDCTTGCCADCGAVFEADKIDVHNDAVYIKT